MENWNGYKVINVNLLNHDGFIVCPNVKPNGKWALKTEYFDAFPDVQLKLLELGWHVAHIVNITRWHKEEDTHARAKLAEYMEKELSLDKKCSIIGMSCGGMQGIYFASMYPELTACLYIDAPVVNLLSCPGNVGKGITEGLWEEFTGATGMTLIDLITYRNHPQDHIKNLIKNKIPVILVAGDSDRVVPYDENGLILEKMYKENGCEIEVHIKKGCDHHPHSLEDNTPIIDFIKSHS